MPAINAKGAMAAAVSRNRRFPRVMPVTGRRPQIDSATAKDFARRNGVLFCFLRGYDVIVV